MSGRAPHRTGDLPSPFRPLPDWTETGHSVLVTDATPTATVRVVKRKWDWTVSTVNLGSPLADCCCNEGEETGE